MGKRMKLKLDDLEINSFITSNENITTGGTYTDPRPTRENTCADEETFGTCCIEPPPGHTNLGCGTGFYSQGGGCPTGGPFANCTGRPECI